MNRVYTFGLLGIRKSNPMTAYRISNRILELTSASTAIFSSQHGYFFIPTTAQQIII